MDTETSKPTSNEVKALISATISEFNEKNSGIQFKRPTTLQGWLYLFLGFSSITAILWTGIVFLNNVANHSKSPYHQGTEELVEALHQDHIIHAKSEELHQRSELLQMQTAEQIRPIKEDLRDIQINQVNIQTNQQNFKEDIRDFKEDLREVQRSINNIADKIE